MSVRQAASVTSSTIVVAVDVGKSSAVFSVTDAGRHRLVGPVGCVMSRPELSAMVHRLEEAVGPAAQVKVGVEAAGHYHRPVLDYGWPTGWEVLELNPAHVSEQRRVAGRRRLKTDAIDLEAITELVPAGRGRPVVAEQLVLGEIGAWAAHRTRRVAVRSATKNQLLGQLDRAFPGVTRALPDVLGTKIGRDGTISREGSVTLRRALIDLGIGLWLTDPAAKTYAAGLKARGKHGGVIACALAHRASRIAYALVRDHATYDPTRWS